MRVVQRQLSSEVLVIVEAVETEPERPRSHVGEKAFESAASPVTKAPALANGDWTVGASSVAVKIVVARIFAALHHRLPSDIGGRHGAVLGVTVYQVHDRVSPLRRS